MRDRGCARHAKLMKHLLRNFARRPATYVQLSGLPFLFQARWRDVDARSVLDDALDILGPRRMLFASDYPMLLRFATYGEWVQYVDEYVAARRLTADESAAVMAGNAREANPRLDVPRTATARVAF
jgi:predicted TIM-barrel fold metal-dependent hydrolase